MLLQAIDIHKTYKQAEQIVPVLRGINLSIAIGDVVAIVGPSGAGKSTLLHILGGLDAPDSGRVICDEKDMYLLSDELRASLRNSTFGFVFQAYHLLAELSALENVILPRMVQKNSIKTSAIEAEGVKLLSQLGLGHRLTHRPSQLSGGEQQRVAIARALMNKPRIMFCDEPTGNLDSKTGDAVIDAIMDLNNNHHMALVIVTHDEQIARRAKRVITMRDGVIEHMTATV